jgi:hypothetical protein
MSSFLNHISYRPTQHRDDPDLDHHHHDDGVQEGPHDEVVHAHWRLAALNAQKLTSVHYRGLIVTTNGRERTYCFSGKKNGKISTAIRISSSGQSKSDCFVIFTTGDFLLNDNFDFYLNKTVAVENCTFGACKVWVEDFEIYNFLQTKTLSRLPANFVENVRKFLGDVFPPNLDLDALLRTPEGRHQFMREVMIQKMHVIDSYPTEIVQKRPKWKSWCNETDMVVKICTEHLVSAKKEASEYHHQAASGSKRSLEGHNPDADLDFATLWKKFRAHRGDLLQQYTPSSGQISPILETNQRVAKLIVGQRVLYPFVFDRWELQDIAKWSVFFTRRFLIAENPELAYPFCLLHWHGKASEISDNDKIWAYEYKPKMNRADAGPLDDLFLPTTNQSGFFDQVEADWSNRKLGPVNRNVAMNLLGEPLSDHDMEQMSFAADYLSQCGWVGWFNDNVRPKLVDVSGGMGSIFEPRRLPARMVLAIKQSGTDHVVALLETLKNGLPHSPPPEEDPPAPPSLETTARFAFPSSLGQQRPLF